MGLAIPFLLVLFFIGGQLEGRAAHSSELADLKALLELLEDRLEFGGKESELQPNDETARDVSQASATWDTEYARPQGEGAFSPSSWEQPVAREPAAARNKLRALFNSPRSLQRSSNCFGQRLDRIGTSTGLGCNRNRN
ncbi:natriuretic peptides A-like [Podarcis raffonei]|uniref:natriuretic peptides A-like n=1 Tax=Podarcis raffonei TaxID=65483 RepID=UPI00232969A2|nr:natriuretic peptides A-like [Podarcis raffonei]